MLLPCREGRATIGTVRRRPRDDPQDQQNEDHDRNNTEDGKALATRTMTVAITGTPKPVPPGYDVKYIIVMIAQVPMSNDHRRLVFGLPRGPRKRTGPSLAQWPEAYRDRRESSTADGRSPPPTTSHRFGTRCLEGTRGHLAGHRPPGSGYHHHQALRYRCRARQLRQLGSVRPDEVYRDNHGQRQRVDDCK